MSFDLNTSSSSYKNTHENPSEGQPVSKKQKIRPEASFFILNGSTLSAKSGALKLSTKKQFWAEIGEHLRGPNTWSEIRIGNKVLSRKIIQMYYTYQEKNPVQLEKFYKTAEEYELDVEKFSELTLAAAMGDESNLTEALNNHSVNDQDSQSITALNIAVIFHQTPIVKLLLQKGAEVDGYSEKWTTPLGYAATNDDLDLIEILVKEGKADINKKDDRLKSPLTYAAEKGNTQALKKLLNMGARVNDYFLDGVTPLFSSVFTNQTEICKILLEHGADPLVRDNMGTTPLIEAARRGYFEICEMLIKAQKKINQVDINKLDALSWAKLLRPENYSRIKHLLLNASSNIQDYNYVILVRLLSHTLKLEGISRFNGDKSFQFEKNGLMEKYSLHRFSKDLENFSKAFPKESPHLQKLADLIKMRSLPPLEDKNLIVERCIKGEPIFSATGFEEHSVYVLLIGNIFIVCNRGGRGEIDDTHDKINAEPEGNLKVLELPPQFFNNNDPKKIKEFFTDLKNLEDKQGIDYAMYMKNLDQISEKFNRISSMISLPKDYIGFCTWVNLEQALIAFMIFNEINEKNLWDDWRLFEQKQDNPIISEIIKKQYPIFKIFRTYQAFVYLEKYIKFVEEKPRYLERNIISKSIAKIIQTDFEKLAQGPFASFLKKRRDELYQRCLVLFSSNL